MTQYIDSDVQIKINNNENNESDCAFPEMESK